MDICLKKCFYEAQNIYPLFKKPRENGWYAYMRMSDFAEKYPISVLFQNYGYFSSVPQNDDVENIHDFKINQLLDSTINLSLTYLAELSL